MGHFSLKKWSLIWAFLMGASVWAVAHAEDQSTYAHEEYNKFIGKDAGFRHQLTLDELRQSLTSDTVTRILGRNRKVLQVVQPFLFSEEIPTEFSHSTLDSGSQAFDPKLPVSDIYIGGMKIGDFQSGFNGGTYVLNAEIPPGQFQVPIFVFPIGPIAVRIDAGIQYQANIHSEITPSLAYPLEFTTIHGLLSPEVVASGYAEGYAKLLLFRGGVGGRINLIDAQADVDARLYFNQHEPLIKYSGKISFLDGRVFAFVDFFRFWSFSWTRFLDHDLLNWGGRCIQIGVGECKP